MDDHPSPLQYGDHRVTSQRSVRFTLAEAPMTRGGMAGRTMVRLVSRTAGYEPAGSLARWTDGGFSVLFDMGGAQHGNSYRDEAKARARFAELTDPRPLTGSDENALAAAK